MNEETLFHEALARVTSQERAAFLDEACAGTPELRAAVDALLAAHAASGAFLKTPKTAKMEHRNGTAKAPPGRPGGDSN